MPFIFKSPNIFTLLENVLVVLTWNLSIGAFVFIPTLPFWTVNNVIAWFGWAQLSIFLILNLPSEETLNKNLINESNHNNYKTHISSPLSNEEIIIPLTIDRNPTSNSYALTHKKRHKHPRTHKTHKIYKHSISSKHKNKHHNKKKSKSSKLISRASTKRSKNYLSTFF